MAVKKKGAASPPKKRTKAVKKPVKKRKTKPSRSKQPSKPIVFNELKKNLWGVLILVSICLTVAMVADIFLQPGKHLKKPDQPARQSSESESASQQVSKPIPVRKPADVKKKKTDEESALAQGVRPDEKPIRYEVYKDVEPTIVEKPVVPVKDKTPRIAIIIDDIGYDRRTAMALFDLHKDITFSVLPFSPFGRQLSQRLHAKGAQLMLHLPMEPVEYPQINPGPGAILSSMSPDVLIDQLKKDLLEIPHVVGVNNHMGSDMTARSAQMLQVFTILKKENLFFIDSRTAPKSQGKASARLLKLSFAQRDVFLDNRQDIGYITGQFKELTDLARRHGTAIGIGHPYKATLEALKILLPKLNGSIRIVRASELTYIPQ